MPNQGDFKSEYEALCVLINSVSKKTLTDDICLFVTSCALKIWSNHEFFSDDYSDALEAITGERYSDSEILTALSCCAETGRALKIPSFFKSITAADKKADSTTSGSVIDALSRLFVALAFANGDFTIEESNAVTNLINQLTEYCSENGVAVKPPEYDFARLVTPMNKDGYKRSTERTKERNDSAANVSNTTNTPGETNILTQLSGGNNDTDADTNEPDIPITITLNFDGTPDDDKVNWSGDYDIADDDNATATVTKQESASEQKMNELLGELDTLVGLENVKNDVHSLINFIKISRLREERGFKAPVVSYHLVFTGNPGTGKTTVARLVAQLYYQMGILPQGQLVETDRSALVAGYVGQTAIKTQKVIQSAMGGVLFIDEAYSLSNDEQDSFGKESIETLLKAMEDHRDELVVIVAGYDNLMHRFIESNPGLRSRFNKYFHFPDYVGIELLKIFERFCVSNGYSIADGVAEPLLQKLSEMYETRSEHFGNARLVRNLFERAINVQADRLARLQDISDKELSELSANDIETALLEVNN
jgi:AAA+ superfamily predicted ATPase